MSGERGVHFPASAVATTAARLPSYTLESSGAEVYSRLD